VAGDERIHLLDRLWRLKREGYPICLSRAAYRALRSNTRKRPIPQIELATPGSPRQLTDADAAL
jgi:hypothetical protein